MPNANNAKTITDAPTNANTSNTNTKPHAQQVPACQDCKFNRALCMYATASTTCMCALRCSYGQKV